MRMELQGLCLLFVVNFAFGSISLPENSSLGSRIVGGIAANNAAFPYIVSIQKYGKHICGGVIINRRFVLTAAQCIASERPSALRVHVGSKTTSLIDGQLFSVDSLHPHRNYKSPSFDYDIGLIRLSRSLSYNTTIQPIRLPANGEEVMDGLYGIVSGWGLNHPNDVKGPDMLHFAIIPIVEQSVCNRLLGNVTKNVDLTDRMFCAGYLSGGIDACQLDAGGPFAVEGKVVGLVSWGIGCAEPNRPGVYVRVSAYIRWIRNTLWWNYMEYI